MAGIFTGKLKQEKGILPPEHLVFESSAYKPIELSDDNFHSIRPYASIKKIAFIDGGQACIQSNSGYALHFIRVYGHIVHKNRTVGHRLTEFYAETQAKGESILFEVKMHPLKGTPPPEIEIDSMDQRLRQGIDRGDVTAVAGIVRRTAELMMAAELAEDLEQGDMLVLDGSLQARFVQERRALDELYTMCMHKKVLATALCKSTRLLTCRGRAIENVLDHEGRWYYYPSCEITAEAHKAELYFVKLHRHSEFIFRFEVYKEQTQVDIGKVLGFLAVNARDAMIPGYPWGLVRADMLARVSNQEKEYLMHRHGIFGRTVHDVLDSAG